MFVIRPITVEDAEGLEQLAFSDYIGMTALPLHRNLLLQSIQKSLESFKAQVYFPKDENYLFVLQDLETGQIGGCCGINSRTGVDEPDFYYKIETIPQTVTTLNVPKEQKILRPTSYQNGPSKICALYMSPHLRHKGLGHLLSLCRFLFIASFTERFYDTIIADMRGVIYPDGRCPFWNALGRHFLNVDMKELMSLLEKGKYFIPEVMPIYPIYISLLPQEAQDTISKTHEDTKAALKMLMTQGFEITDKIDWFDAGPVISAPKDNIAAIRDSRTAVVQQIAEVSTESPLYLISNQSLAFRCCLGHIDEGEDGKVILTQEVAQALNIQPGDTIRYILN